jgi:hypothetical protein
LLRERPVVTIMAGPAARFSMESVQAAAMGALAIRMDFQMVVLEEAVVDQRAN